MMQMRSAGLEMVSLPRAEHNGLRDTRLPHVVLLVDQFPKALGGGERVLIKLASQLPDYGFSVSIVTFSVDPESAVLSMKLGCPLYVLPLKSAFGAGSILAALAFANFLEQQQVRLVQTFFESSDLWGGLVTHFLSDAKLIWSRRDMGILRGQKHRLAYRALSNLPDKVFTVSEQVRKHAIDTDNIAPRKAATIYNGLDLSTDTARTYPGDADAPLHIVTVGNIRRVKGHDVFIRAASIVAQQYANVRFTIAGEVLEQDYFIGLQRLVTSLGLEERFHFAGNVSDTRAFLNAADIFVLPSRSEGFSNAIIEAMASGLPVIATDVGGNAEAIDDQVSGLIVDPDNVEALSNAILSLCTNPPLAESLGVAGQQRVAQHFTTTIMMERTAALYREVLYEN